LSDARTRARKQNGRCDRATMNVSHPTQARKKKNDKIRNVS
jgi:hypothetical protein